MGDEAGEYARALSLLGTGAYEAALDALRRVAASEPDHPEVKLALIELARRAAQRGSGRPALSDEAAADFHVALGAYRATDPTLTDAEDRRYIASIHFRLGMRCHQLGQFEDAVGFYRDSLAVDPTGDEAALNLSSLLLADGQAQGLADLLRPVLAAHPANPALHRNFIATLFELDLNDEAIAAITNAGRLVPGMRFQYAGYFYRNPRAGTVLNA